ncbi:MAG TPA: T9SS type A sorting domain-containing protein, partial [Chitinophagaceae bacterium]|nr:T9SS type A sorting domain-containing protein [Chitinophagaceae bacterium]
KIIVSSNKPDGYRLARFLSTGVIDNSFAANGELANRETQLSLMKLTGNYLFVAGNRSVTKYLLTPACTYSCPTVSPMCETSEGVYNIPPLQLPAGCTGEVSYAITGATIRSRSSNNASGVFNAGESIITWTINDGSNNISTCQTTVIINARPLVALSGGFALPKGTFENTVYVGYAPASSLNLTSSVTSGTAPYQYSWSSGSSSGANLTVSPATATTYTLKVTDANGCAGKASQKVSVMDIRCGNKMDKVELCNTQLKNILKGNSQCVSTNAVTSHLANGAYLGSCEEVLKAYVKEHDWLKKGLKLIVLNNPSRTSFTFVISSDDARPITIKVYTSFGVLVEQFGNIRSGEQAVGHNYKPGLYYVEVIQGNEKATAKIIKE